MDTSRAPFNRCIPVILAAEGGLVNHASDSGDLANYGISQRRYPGLDITHLAPANAAVREEHEVGSAVPLLDDVQVGVDRAT